MIVGSRLDFKALTVFDFWTAARRRRRSDQRGPPRFRSLLAMIDGPTALQEGRLRDDSAICWLCRHQARPLGIWDADGLVGNLDHAASSTIFVWFGTE
jgi:hypothetical protein